MCVHSDLDAQIPLLCLTLDVNSQSEIILTASKLLLPFSQSSISHLLLDEALIFTRTHTLLLREEDGGILLLSNGTALCLNSSSGAASSAGAAFGVSLWVTAEGTPHSKL